MGDFFEAWGLMAADSFFRCQVIGKLSNWEPSNEEKTPVFGKTRKTPEIFPSPVGKGDREASSKSFFWGSNVFFLQIPSLEGRNMLAQRKPE